MLDSLIAMLMGWHISQNTAEYLAVFIILFGIGLLGIIANYIVKRYIVQLVRVVVAKSNSPMGQSLLEARVFHKLSHLAPGLIIYSIVPLIRGAELSFVTDLAYVIQVAAQVYMLLAVVLFIMSFLDAFRHYYQRLKFASQHPIGGYIQLLKILITAVTAVLAVSIILNKSPWAFFTGLGAISAVLMLVFKDTILGFVASIQVSAYDMVRVGDWIVLPSYNANGDVIEVNINTVKIRNFDMTVVTVPTYALITNGVTNWRGMTESGGRRIKRSVNIDLHSIRFCDEKMIAQFKKMHYLHDYIEAKEKEIADYNAEHKVDKSVMANGRALTNVGVFRAYLNSYLRSRGDIHMGLTFLIRQLQATDKGLPIQLYIFTNDTNWVNYEGIQADIFDHIYAALPVFGLEPFQAVSGHLSCEVSASR